MENLHPMATVRRHTGLHVETEYLPRGGVCIKTVHMRGSLLRQLFSHLSCVTILQICNDIKTWYCSTQQSICLWCCMMWKWWGSGSSSMLFGKAPSAAWLHKVTTGQADFASLPPFAISPLSCCSPLELMWITREEKQSGINIFYCFLPKAIWFFGWANDVNEFPSFSQSLPLPFKQQHKGEQMHLSHLTFSVCRQFLICWCFTSASNLSGSTASVHRQVGTVRFSRGMFFCLSYTCISKYNTLIK